MMRSTTQITWQNLSPSDEISANIREHIAKLAKFSDRIVDCRVTIEVHGEIAAWIGENCFDKLDAPVLRCASLDTPIPFSLELEKNFMAYSRFGEMVERLMNY